MKKVFKRAAWIGFPYADASDKLPLVQRARKLLKARETPLDAHLMVRQ